MEYALFLVAILVIVFADHLLNWSWMRGAFGAQKRCSICEGHNVDCHFCLASKRERGA